MYLASRKIKKGFQEMQSRMQEQMQQQNYSPQSSATEPPKKTKAGDYIEFEEIK